MLLVGSAGAAEVPGTAGRVIAGGYVEGLAVAGTGDGPRQRPQALVDVDLDGAVTRWLRARLDVRERVGGPFEGGSGPNLYDLSHTFQNYSPATEVSEAYLDGHFRRADLRLGVQKIAWGKLDGAPPTDVLNPHDFHDPIVQDFEERKIGIPAALATYYLPDLARLDLSGLRATLVWVPFAVPPRLALREERWFPVSQVPPASVTIPASAVASAGFPPRPLVIPATLLTENHRPPRRLDAGGVALRIGGTWRESDWDIYHYTGPETGPDVALVPELFLDAAPSATRPLRVHALTRLRQNHDTIHMTGADWAMPLGGFTLRAEAAFFNDRPYLRLASDLTSPAALARLPLRAIARQLVRNGHTDVSLGELFPARDSIEWGVGADTVWHGVLPLLQINQIALLESAPPLVIADPETRLGGTLRKRYLSERLELEVRGVYAFERQAWYVFPRASYLVRDDLRVRLGYLAIGGPRGSLIGQFRDNDEVVLQARWSF